MDVSHTTLLDGVVWTPMADGHDEVDLLECGRLEIEKGGVCQNVKAGQFIHSPADDVPDALRALTDSVVIRHRSPCVRE